MARSDLSSFAPRDSRGGCPRIQDFTRSGFENLHQHWRNAEGLPLCSALGQAVGIRPDHGGTAPGPSFAGGRGARLV